MALHRQTVRTGQTRRPRPHHRDTPPCRCGTAKGMHVLVHQPIRGIALQPPDQHRLPLGCLTHTGLFTQRFRGANAGAHTAKDVLAEDRLGRRLGRAGGDLPDKERDVDRGGAGGDAGRVVAEITAIRRHQRLVIIKRGMQIGEIALQGGGINPACDDTRGELAISHGVLRSRMAEDQYSTILNFINW